MKTNRFIFVINALVIFMINLYGGNVAADGFLKVGITPVYDPIIYKQDGEIRGIEAELAKLLAKKLNRKLQFEETLWTEHFPALLAGKIDIVMSGMSITNERLKTVSFSPPYLSTGLITLFRRNDLSAFSSADALKQSGVKIGYIADSTAQIYIKDRLKVTSAKAFSNPRPAVEELRSGEIDIFIHDSISILWQAEQHKAELVSSQEFLTEEFLAWAIRKDDLQLQDAASSLMKELKESGELAKIILKHIPSMN